MKVKGGGRRKSWDAVTEEDLADDNNPPNNDDDSPSLLVVDAQQQQQQQQHQQQTHDPQHPVLPLPLNGVEAQPQGYAIAAADDAIDDNDADDDADADENTERPKLDEGFYEIEAIRRKRVRKVLTFFFFPFPHFTTTATFTTLFIASYCHSN